MRIRSFDPAGASEPDLADYHALRSAADVVDFPRDPPPTYGAAIGRLRDAPVPGAVSRHWVAGRFVGSAKVSLPGGDNAGLAIVGVVVHPESRGRGVGTELLRAALPALHGCRVAIGSHMTQDGSGARWTERLGFVVTSRAVQQRLTVGSVPVQAWNVAVPPGYRLTRWTGAAPADLLDSYAAARDAMHDAPANRLSYRVPRWTGPVIRASERELASSGVEERVVVAIDAADGRVIGVTAMRIRPHSPEIGVQNDTSVLAAHRGHGLGRAMKAAMMRRLVAERPDVERIMTTTAADNTYMITVNHALGYDTLRTLVTTEVPVEKLVEALASRQVPR
jgi:RimJ/RimL family protein N-acetyltransferase